MIFSLHKLPANTDIEGDGTAEEEALTIIVEVFETSDGEGLCDGGLNVKVILNVIVSDDVNCILDDSIGVTDDVNWFSVSFNVINDTNDVIWFSVSGDVISVSDDVTFIVSDNDSLRDTMKVVGISDGIEVNGNVEDGVIVARE